MNLPSFDPRPDIRLIAADMDGTLLDDDKELHDHFWPLVEALHERGILFCPASGRQFHTLHRLFGTVADDLVYIAENGAYVLRGRTEIGSSTLPTDLVDRLVATGRELSAGGADIGVVVCGKLAAYIDRDDPAFMAEVDQYYASRRVLADLSDRPYDQILKVAFFDFAGAEDSTYPALQGYRSEAGVVLSGAHWVDVQDADTDKGVALRRIQQALGITPDQTMVFGDFLNDLAMMDAATWSFAMDNAHPLLRERARHIAPPNTENGVVRTISAALGLPWTDHP